MAEAAACEQEGTGAGMGGGMGALGGGQLLYTMDGVDEGGMDDEGVEEEVRFFMLW